MGNSALGRGTAIEENKVKASSGATADFLDGIVDADTMLVTANQLVSVNEFKVGNFSREMTAATGSVGYTGIGFQPKAVMFFAAVNNDNLRVTYTGATDGTTSRQLISYASSGADIVQTGGGIMQFRQQLGPDLVQTAALGSFDADGFTIDWTLSGSPAAATITVNFIAFK